MNSAIYPLKYFDKLVWIDPNTGIEMQQKAMQELFGAKCKHFSSIQTALQLIASSPESLHLLIMTSKIYLDIKDAPPFKESAYDKFILFCGNRERGEKLMSSSNGRICQVATDVNELYDCIYKLEIQLMKNQATMPTKFPMNIYLVYNEVDRKLLKNTLGNELNIELLHQQKLREVLQNDHKQKLQSILISYGEDITGEFIEDTRGDYQYTRQWYRIVDDTNQEGKNDAFELIKMSEVKELPNRIKNSQKKSH